ncbi:MAG: DUF72 domain-containing protein [Anaerolineales bacterium]|nr:DUF72 domain-containing protein [Anaerolineales bacterium]MDW8161425.1 DUF72 domain-containing protein [Anaerolineales bacterium]
MEGAEERFFVGTSGWNYPDWRGKFYPEGLSQKRWLEYYATQFKAVEVNATFYRKFNDRTYQNWFARTPPHFRFVLKAPRTITHLKHLLDVEEEIRSFERTASLLAEKLGLILLQIAPDTPFDLQRLKSALMAFNQPTRVAVEFRQKQWWGEETYGLLREVGAVLVNPDCPGHALCDRWVSEVGYLRLHGRRRWYFDLYAAEELQAIAETAQRMAGGGCREVYIFFNNTPSGFAAQNALDLQKQLALAP